MEANTDVIRSASIEIRDVTPNLLPTTAGRHENTVVTNTPRVVGLINQLQYRNASHLFLRAFDLWNMSVLLFYF